MTKHGGDILFLERTTGVFGYVCAAMFCTTTKESNALNKGHHLFSGSLGTGVFAREPFVCDSK